MAQRVYFIYLQTEHGEPFFVRVADKIYNSTAAGYLILSKLKDSTYNFKIGFPGKDIDLNFSSTINKKDHGFLVKNFGDKGWGLFDMQTMGIQMSSSTIKTVSQVNNAPAIQVNAFTDLLSKAADDPSLKQNPILVKEEEKKPEEKRTGITQTVVKETRTEILTSPVNKPEEKKTEITPPVAKETRTEILTPPANKPEEKKVESANTNDQKAEQTAKMQDTIQKEVTYKRSQITKVSEMAVPEGLELVFIDDNKGDIDTVRIILPGDRTPVLKEETKPEVKKEEKKFLDITTDASKPADNVQPDFKKDEKRPEPVKEKKTVISDIKNGCRSVAAESDFLRLRRKMAGGANDDRMIGEAKKYFKIKCFTTEQIRNLSSLFLSNAGKYHFFDVSYEYVADKENFSSLQSELKDEYYIKRFKAMLPN
jgi:hypothetical protein